MGAGLERHIARPAAEGDDGGIGIELRNGAEPPGGQHVMDADVLERPGVRGRMGKHAGEGLAAFDAVSLQTYFFMPCGAGTHGPPDSLQPGEPAMASSRPSWSARVVAYLKASFHSGVM